MLRHSLNQQGTQGTIGDLLTRIESDAGIAGLDVLLLEKSRGYSVFQDVSAGQFGTYAQTESFIREIDSYLSKILEIEAPIGTPILTTGWTATTTQPAQSINIRELEYVVGS
ncbi:MAG: hypothetical protein ACRC62_32070 [Microcoleus sp.]